jgi:hypothetical protein
MRNTEYLKDVPGDKAFWVNNGTVIKNLQELPGALESMNDSSFAFHVNKEKNDFALWVREVVGDKMLAVTLQMVKTRRGTIDAVNRRIKQLKS